MKSTQTIKFFLKNTESGSKGFLKKPAFLFVLWGLLTSVALAQGFDHSELDRFLKHYVRADGRVDYAAAKKNASDLNHYLKRVEVVDLLSLESGPKQEHLAFWLNVYHAGLLALILENYPLQSTKDIPDFWERQFLKVGKTIGAGEVARYSLSGIRTGELLGRHADEKIHLALSLGALGGPQFPQEAFTGPRVLGQLFKCARREVARSESVQIQEEDGKVKLSQIFEWHVQDFVKNFGRPEKRGKLSFTQTVVINFLIRYSKKLSEVKFLKSTQYRIEYFPLNWSLNDSSQAA